MCFSSGILLFTLIDSTCASWNILLFAFLEVITVSWMYGIDRFFDNLEEMGELWATMDLIFMFNVIQLYISRHETLLHHQVVLEGLLDRHHTPDPGRAGHLEAGHHRTGLLCWLSV